MRVSVPENFQNSAVGRFPFLEKLFFNRHGRCPCQALNGWTVRRFHGARVGGAERQAERQLPARLQDEGNDRGLEAHKITALTFAWGPIGQTPDFYPRNAHGAVTVVRR